VLSKKTLKGNSEIDRFNFHTWCRIDLRQTFTLETQLTFQLERGFVVQLYIDTANIDEIREISEWGILDGVTTNPSLLAKEGRDLEDVIREISSLVPGPISAEVVALDAEGMIKEGKELAALAENVVVKIPMTPEGLKAVSALRQEGIACNVTLVFSAGQALLAARAGAAYVSPFMGRLDDIGVDSGELLRDIADILIAHQLDAKIIAASIRHPQHVLAAALAGADIGTIPYDVFNKMVGHPLTDQGLEKFLSDWHALQENKA